MKKIIYTLVTLFLLASVCIIAVVNSIVHVRLQHGDVLHVLPTYNKNKADGAVIICPGGGYSYLEKWYEGYGWFPFFMIQGYTPAMLEYRMPKQNYKSPMIDGAEAVIMMRKHAKEWHFDENNVGIMGSSAGGHLASTLMVVNNDAVRPDFGILFYPVISMRKELTHIDSHDQLLGKGASPQLENQYSNELHVSDKTPPVFIAVTSDDACVSPRNSILFDEKMHARNRRSELHIYPTGGHGFVCHLRSEYRGQVLEELADWLSVIKLQNNYGW